MQVSTAEFRKGLRIVFDGHPYTIVEFQHVKPGKGGAFVRTKLKHMRLGKVIDNTFRSGEKVALVDFEDKHMQFLYRDDRYHFMDLETYEQVSLSGDEVGDARDWLKENTEVDVLYIEGRPVAVELPNFVELAIAKTDPGVRGDTAQGGTKPATLQPGAALQELGLAEIEVAWGEVRVRVQRPTAAPTQQAVAPATSEEGGAAPLVSEAVPAGMVSVEAPMVGTFYRAPSPSAEPYVNEGTVVKEGQILCIIEAMKLMNEIESKVGGRIVKIFVENGHAVEYGQPLFLIDPAR